jgi:hypothetical protein
MSNMYIVCCGTNGRAVLVGESNTEPEAGKPITLTNARMVLYWDAACGGLLGLAANGPKGATRITAAVERHGDDCVRQWVTVSEAARKEIEAWKPC